MPETRPRWQQALYFLLGIAAVALVGWIAMRFWPKPQLPDGWLRLAPPHDVMALVEYRGQIWSGGRDGVVVLDPDSGAILEEVEGDVPFDYVTGIIVSVQDNGLWVSHMRGVSLYDGTGWQTLTAADGLTPGRALALAEGRDGALWIGTEGGVTHYRDGTYTRYTTADGLMTQGCACLFVDGQDRLWCGSGYTWEDGVSVFDGQRWQPMAQLTQLAHPMLNAMLETEDGALWFATGFSAEGGLSIHDGNTWRALTKEDGLAGSKVRSLFQDESGAIWVSSEYNGTVRMTQGGLQSFTPKEGLAGWEVKAMLQDSRGNLWLGTELGLTRISHEAWIALGE